MNKYTYIFLPLILISCANSVKDELKKEAIKKNLILKISNQVETTVCKEKTFSVSESAIKYVDSRELIGWRQKQIQRQVLLNDLSNCN